MNTYGVAHHMYVVKWVVLSTYQVISLLAKIKKEQAITAEFGTVSNKNLTKRSEKT